MKYIVGTGPADTLQALDEVMRRRAPELRGDLMTCGEMLRQEGRQEGELKGRREGELKGRQEGELKGRREGELKGRQEGELKGRREGRLETIDGLLRAGVKWPVIHTATGIDEPTYHTLKRAAANGTEQTAPRQ